MTTPLAEYGRLLVTRWRWLAWGILIALAVTTAVLVLWPPLYRSDATLFVRTPGDVSRVDDGGDSYARARAGTYAVLVKSTSISSRVVANLGLDMRPETLSRRISASHPDGTALIDVGVSAPSAEEARRTATVLLSEFATTVRSLESVPGSLVPRAEIVVVDAPSEPERILAWGAPLYLVVLGAILVGLVCGALGAVIRSSLSEPIEPEGVTPPENQGLADDKPTADHREAFDDDDNRDHLTEVEPSRVDLAPIGAETERHPDAQPGSRRRRRRKQEALTEANGSPR